MLPDVIACIRNPCRQTFGISGWFSREPRRTQFAYRRVNKKSPIRQYGWSSGWKSLVYQIFNEDIGRVVAERQIGNLASVCGNIQDAVGEPTDASVASFDFRHTHVIRGLGDLGEVGSRFFRNGTTE